MDPEEKQIAVVGAGLAGCMVALLLARRRDNGRKYNVHVYERRQDYADALAAPIASAAEAGVADDAGQAAVGNSTDSLKRSINLALSHRGRCALKAVELEDAVMAPEIAVPMPVRAIHDGKGNIRQQPYGTNGEAIYSVSRSVVTDKLVEELRKQDNVTFHFGWKLKRVDRFGRMTMLTDEEDEQVVETGLVVGADGAYSAVRGSLLRHCRADFSRHYIEHSYKELDIPPSATGDFQLPTPNALHIWPHHEFMMIALPNPDKSFTCTLFAPVSMFEKLDKGTDEEVEEFFRDKFPDAVPVLPNLVQQYRANPAGALVTVKLNPWHLDDKIVLIGDAAHAVVPFYGQGMNAAFEDALTLSETIGKHSGALGAAVRDWAETRQPAGEGIMQLSFDNYVEMRSHTASITFLVKKQMEGVLHWLMPSVWTPVYTMVAFRSIPYHEVLAQQKRQDEALSTALTVFGVAALAGAAFFLGRRYLKVNLSVALKK